MKNFFGKLLGKKYPDRNGETSRKMGRVYAGPPAKDDEPVEVCVYAGPPAEDEEDIRQIRLVYAGPPASLDPAVDDVEIEEVYNGPGMMDEIGWEPVEEPEEVVDPDTVPEEDTAKEDVPADPVEEPVEEPEEVDPDTVTGKPSAKPANTEDAHDVNSMLMAYAGPAMLNPNLLEPLTVTAYAGPNMMNNQMFQMQDPGMPMAMLAYFGPGGPNGPVPAGMMSVMPNVEETPDSSKDLIREEHKVCPVCGKILHPNTRFCPDCGMYMRNEPVQEGKDI